MNKFRLTFTHKAGMWLVVLHRVNKGKLIGKFECKSDAKAFAKKMKEVYLQGRFDEFEANIKKTKTLMEKWGL